MTSWARQHAARRQTQQIIDRLVGVSCISVSASRWRRLIASDRGPPDPITRLVLLALASVSSGDQGQHLTHRDIARLTALGERSVRDRLTSAIRHGWIIAGGPQTCRAYRPAVPLALRRHVPDRAGQMRHHMPDSEPPIRHGVPADDDEVAR